MENMRYILEKLLDFEHSASLYHFYMIFGEAIGGHLWRKFSEDYNFNFLDFFGTLDNENRNKTSNYLWFQTLNKKSYGSTIQA